MNAVHDEAAEEPPMWAQDTEGGCRFLTPRGWTGVIAFVVVTVASPSPPQARAANP